MVSFRSAQIFGPTALALVLVGCVGDPIPDLAVVKTCPAADISITTTGAKETPKPGSQHTDSVTVTVVCLKPPPPVPIAGASVAVTWPGGAVSTGTTNASGVVTVTSRVFPTASGPGDATVSVNGNDGKSQNEKATIP